MTNRLDITRAPTFKLYGRTIEEADSQISFIQNRLGTYEVTPDGRFLWFEDRSGTAVKIVPSTPDEDIDPRNPLPFLNCYTSDGTLKYQGPYISTVQAVQMIRTSVRILISGIEPQPEKEPIDKPLYLDGESLKAMGILLAIIFLFTIATILHR